jgi:hypothetical protein
MRKSIIKQDPGYDPEAWKYSVYLDGERIEYVFIADEENEFVTIFDPSIAGSFMKGKPGQPVMKVLNGEVEIKED